MPGKILTLSLLIALSTLSACGDRNRQEGQSNIRQMPEAGMDVERSEQQDALQRPVTGPAEDIGEGEPGLGSEADTTRDATGTR